jgi:hypothetical protein
LPDWLVFAPGAVLILTSFVVGFSGYMGRSSRRVMLGIRLRYGGLAALMVLPGIQLVVIGLLSGPRWGQAILGLIVIGFGGLWMIGLTGIPKGPVTRNQQ